MRRVARLMAATAALALSLHAVADARFVVVTHAPDADPFWNVVKSGVRDAEKDFGVSADCRNPPSGDLADMNRLLEQAGAHNVRTVEKYAGQYR